MAERRQREREERREQIIDAAEQVFFASGVDVATMDDVAAGVELSKGALYLYFKSKEELYTAVMNRCHATVVTDLEGEAMRDVTGLEQLAGIARVYLRFLQQQPGHVRLLLAALVSGRLASEAANHSSEHCDLSLREFSAVVGAAVRGKQDGSLRGDVDPKLLAVQLWGGLTGMMTLALLGEQMKTQWPEPVDVDAAFPAFIDLMLRGIAAQPQDVERLSGVA